MYQNVYSHDEMKRAEHMAVRTTAGWYLFTHQLIEVQGEDATAFLDYLYANPIGNLKITRARYTTMLDENGLIRDDVVIFRMDENRYWVSTLYTRKVLPWYDSHKAGFSVTYRDITPEWDMYSIQGPRSLELLNAVIDQPADEVKFFQMLDNTMDGIPVKINRGGFSGEKLGYELYISPEHTKKAVEKLREAAPKFDAKQITDIQVMVWTLPTERGYYLMGEPLRGRHGQGHRLGQGVHRERSTFENPRGRCKAHALRLHSRRGRHLYPRTQHRRSRYTRYAGRRGNRPRDEGDLQLCAEQKHRLRDS